MKHVSTRGSLAKTFVYLILKYCDPPKVGSLEALTFSVYLATMQLTYAMKARLSFTSQVRLQYFKKNYSKWCLEPFSDVP